MGAGGNGVGVGGSGVDVGVRVGWVGETHHLDIGDVEPAYHSGEAVACRERSPLNPH